jgi:hypothetical protein
MSSAVDSSGPPSHRDLGGRLTVFGALTVIIGVFTVLLGILSPLATKLLAPADAPALDPRSLISAIGLYAILGAVLFWVGIGSLRRRRWVRSIKLTVGWSWLLFGTMSLLMSLGMIDRILEVAQYDQPLPVEVVGGIKLLTLGLIFALGVAYPAALIVAYRDPDVLATCVARHPQPDWSEQLPSTVVGLGVGWTATAVLGLPMALQPVVPVFGRLVTGWGGLALLLFASALFAVVGREVFRMRPAGWWGSSGLMLLIGASTGWTFAGVDLADVLRAMHYPEDQIGMMGIPRSWLVGATVLFTGLSLAYMVSIRHHFANPGARD